METSQERRANRLNALTRYMFEVRTQMPITTGLYVHFPLWLKTSIDAKGEIKYQDKIYFYVHGFDEGGFKNDVQVRMVVREQGSDG